MKRHFLIIFISIFFGSDMYAQKKSEATADTFDWTSRDSSFSAAVTIFYPPAAMNAKNKLPAAYFLSFQNEPRGIAADFGKMIDHFTDSLPCVAVQIVLVNNSIRNSSILKLPNEFSSIIFFEIKTEIEKRNSALTAAGHIILAGLNDAAIVALAASAAYKSTISGTALIFLDYHIPDSISTANLLFLSSAEDKVFIYVRGNEVQNQNAGSFADDIASSSSLFVYKIDETEIDAGENLFSEMYNWLRAIGNNYIITTD